jgi:hypothetical protein
VNELQPGVPIGRLAELRTSNPGRGPHSIIGPIAVKDAEPPLPTQGISCDNVNYDMDLIRDEQATECVAKIRCQSVANSRFAARNSAVGRPAESQPSY